MLSGQQDPQYYLDAVMLGSDQTMIQNAHQWLIKENSFTDEELSKLLFYAARRGYRVLLQALADREVDLNSMLFTQTTALHEAVEKNQIDAILFLLGKGAEQYPNEAGQYPLDIAAMSNHIETAYLLYQNLQAREEVGLNIPPINFALTVCDMNLAWLAIDKNDFDLLQWAVKKDKSLLTRIDKHENNSLLFAIKRKRDDIAKWLIDQQGLSVDFRNCHGKNAVLKASSNGCLTLLTWLVDEKHCSLDIKDKHLRNPLHLAAFHGHLDIVTYLVDEKHLDLNANSYDGRNSVMYGALGSHLHILQYLVDKKGCSLDTVDNENRSPLMCATASKQYNKPANEPKWRDTQVVKWLIENKKCSVSQKDLAGKNVTLYAAAEGQLEILMYLIHREGLEASFKVVNDNGNNILLIAAAHDQLTIVKSLLGLNLTTSNMINAKSNSTAFLQAARYGAFSVLEYLLTENPAHLQEKTIYGSNAATVACVCNQLRVLQLLVNYDRALLKSKNNLNSNLLISAVSSDNLDIAKWLVNQDETLLLEENTAGDNALLTATKLGQMRCLTWLLTEKNQRFDINSGTLYIKVIRFPLNVFIDCFPFLFESTRKASAQATLFKQSSLINAIESQINQSEAKDDDCPDKTWYRALYENAITSLREYGDEAANKFLCSYLKVDCKAAFHFHTERLIRENHMTQLINFCWPYINKTNASSPDQKILYELAVITITELLLQDKINLVEEQNIFPSFFNSTLKHAIQAFYLLKDCQSDDAIRVRQRFHEILSGNNKCFSTGASEATWTQEAIQYYLLYTLYKQHSDDSLMLTLFNRITKTKYTKETTATHGLAPPAQHAHRIDYPLTLFKLERKSEPDLQSSQVWKKGYYK